MGTCHGSLRRSRAQWGFSVRHFWHGHVYLCGGRHAGLDSHLPGTPARHGPEVGQHRFWLRHHRQRNFCYAAGRMDRRPPSEALCRRVLHFFRNCHADCRALHGCRDLHGWAAHVSRHLCRGLFYSGGHRAQQRCPGELGWPADTLHRAGRQRLYHSPARRCVLSHIDWPDLRQDLTAHGIRHGFYRRRRFRRYLSVRRALCRADPGHDCMIMLLWFLGFLLAAMWLVPVLRFAMHGSKVADLNQPEWQAPPGTPLPSLTIVVPARNEQAEIEPALRSLMQLNFPQYEIIAVDDRSTDATGAILDRLAAAPQSG